MKKWIALLLALCMLTVLTACGGGSGQMVFTSETEIVAGIAGEGTAVKATAAAAHGEVDTDGTQDGTDAKTKGKTSVTTKEKDSKKTTKTTGKAQSATTAVRTRTTRSTTAATTTTKKTTTSFVRRTTVKRTYPTDKQIVVTCVGDSITKGEYYCDPAGNANIADNMQGALSDRYKIRGYGLFGATAMSKGLDNGEAKGYITTSEYSNSIRGTSDIIVIMLGTNDAKDYNWEMDGNENGAHFKESLINLVTSYQNLSNSPTVILATPPKIFTNAYEWVPAYLPEKINPIIKEVAELTGCRVADVYAATENANWQVDFKDGIHPSTATGKALIAHTIAEVIKEETGVA